MAVSTIAIARSRLLAQLRASKSTHVPWSSSIAVASRALVPLHGSLEMTVRPGLWPSTSSSSWYSAMRPVSASALPVFCAVSGILVLREMPTRLVDRHLGIECLHRGAAELTGAQGRISGCRHGRVRAALPEGDQFLKRLSLQLKARLSEAF